MSYHSKKVALPVYHWQQKCHSADEWVRSELELLQYEALGLIFFFFFFFFFFSSLLADHTQELYILVRGTLCH